MALKSYIITQDYKAPYVIYIGHPKKTNDIRLKQFKKGEIIRGELKHANNKPAFVLLADRIVIPLQVVKEVVAKEIRTDENKIGIDGLDDKKDFVPLQKEKNFVSDKLDKVKYVDAAIFGAALGFGGMYLAEKKGWVQSLDNKNKIYATVGGALAAIYIMYRIKEKSKTSKVTIKQ